MCDACRNPGFSRRGLLGFALAAVVSRAGAALADAAPANGPAPNAIDPDEALKRLMDGNARYAGGGADCKDFLSGRAARAQAQYPIAAVLSCADSRVAPEILFDQGLGDVFVVRVAGNFVHDDGLASLEYAVRFLGAPLIVVLGHSGCGAVEAAIKALAGKATLPGHLPELARSIYPAVAAAKARKGDLLTEATQENVRLNVRRLAGAEPVLGRAVGVKKLRVVGGYYDIATGRVSLL